MCWRWWLVLALGVLVVGVADTPCTYVLIRLYISALFAFPIFLFSTLLLICSYTGDVVRCNQAIAGATFPLVEGINAIARTAFPVVSEQANPLLLLFTIVCLFATS